MVVDSIFSPWNNAVMIACRPYDHVVPLDYSLVPIMPMYWVCMYVYGDGQ